MRQKAEYAKEFRLEEIWSFTCGGTGESPLATLLFRHDLNDHEIEFVIMGMFYVITFHVSNLLFSEIFVLLFLAENAKSRTD